ncbi:MAG: 3',5'-cyclic-AMP phosphodiesterase [Methylomonas sp.]
MLKILQLSDLHILQTPTETLLGIDTEYYFGRVLQAAHADHGPFDLILTTGDLAQDPCRESYQRIRQHFEVYGTRVLCLPGNHDDFSLMQAILNDGWVSCQKQLLLENWQIICLNSQKPGSPVGELRSEELAFLENCLLARPEVPALVAVHHHCIPSGCDWLDTMQIENSGALLELLGRHSQVKAVTCGHVHKQMSSQYGGIGIFSAPATCFQFKLNSTQFSVENTPPGYRIFELAADGSYSTACYSIDEPLKGLVKDVHSY